MEWLLVCRVYAKRTTQKHGIKTLDYYDYYCYYSWCYYTVQSRAAYSLLAYCYYQLGDFVNSADCYEQLTELHPDVDYYRLYYAQALYKASLYEEAMKVSSQIDSPAYRLQVGSTMPRRCTRPVFMRRP